MTNQFRQPVQAVVFLLVLASVLFSTGSLRAQGFSKIPPPPGTVSLVPKQDRGLTHFFVDSTLFEVRLNRLRRDTRLDSSQQLLVVEEKYFDDDYRLPAAVDLAYYQKLRLEEDVRNLWTRSVLEHIEYGNRSGAAGIELNIPLRIKNNAFRRIFGGDRVGLVVSGNITFELAGRTESREGSAISSIDQRNNFAPKFKQTQQFRVEGRVGDKVTVSVDQNSEATFDFENTLKLTYEGDEDEIVQRIEAGNVALNLPSTNYVSASQNHQGLFGLKTEMQVGKLSFTGIASLERGENQTLSVTGSSNENTRNIKDTEYVRNQFFFVDDYYQEHFEGDLITQNMQLTVSLDRKVRQLDVWKTVNVAGGNGRTNSFHAVAVLDPAVYDQNRGVLDTLSTRNGYVHEGQFERLTEGEDYEVDYLRGYFRMKSRVDENSEVLAVSYSYGPDANIENVGDLAQDIQANLTDSTIVLLRLIKPQGNQPTYPTWPLTMRNVYNLGGAVTADGFETRVIYTKEGNDDEVDDNGRTYNFLMGLDRVDEQGAIAEGGDKKVDLGKSFIFNLQDGYLVFPSLTPFSPGLFPSSGANVFTDFPDAQRVEIYDIKDNTEELKRSKFAIEVTTTSSSSTFDLGFNVLEGSETVRLNGAILQRDKDYIIDYFSGRLEITDPEARRADAKVDIEYERGALFQLDKKTLLGGRLAYEFRETDFVALTTMFYSKSTLDQRVRLGQEPIRNFIWDLNTALNFKPNFLTKVLDALPVVETQAESKLRIEAEYAQVNPNPNTFNEEELGDKDGVAYIDDFEGSKRTTTLGIQYRVWTGSSVPVRFTRINSPNKGHLAPSGGPALKDYILNQDANRVDFNWYNPFDDVPIRSIFPNRDVNSQTGTTTKVLNLRWQNDDVDADSAWAGIMRSTLTFADQQKTKFLELWVRGETGQVNIDIGSISEDFYVKGQYPNPDVAGDFLDSYQGLNTEDVNFNGLLEDDEDVGIDGVPGADGQNVPNDAGNDDFRALQQDDPNVAGINGTEGNSQIQGARYPDTEDLNGDGGLTTLNDYFAYSFDLSQEEYLVSRTRDPESGELTGWKQYRIPLDDFRFKIGNPNPNFQEIYYVRLWLNDLQPDGQQHNMQIAAFDFVGNEWEEEGLYTANGQGPTLDDDKFSITVYNTEEHADPPVSYQSPPGVEGIKDRITQAVSKEQSLVMEIKDLGPGMRAEARKQLRERINLLNYQRLKMFMYGRNIDAASQPDTVMFYMRFGPTDQIYYEYRQPVYEGWNNNDVEIDFGELTDTKQDQYLNLDSTRIGVPASNAERDVFYRRTSDGREFIVVGQPGLHNIDYLIFGALNTSTMSSVTDDETTKHEIWLDELRVTGVERNSGSAMRLSMNLDAGGVFNVRGNWELKDADFRRLEDQFASTDGKDKTVQKQSYNFKIGLHKLLPSSWNLNIPLFMQYNRSLEVPKYYYNSDRRTGYELGSFGDRMSAFFGLDNVDPTLSDQVKYNDGRSIGGEFSRKGDQKDPWYLKWTLNQVRLDLDYSESGGYSPTVLIQEATKLNGSFNYTFPFGREKYFKPLSFLGNSALLRGLSNQRLYYLPSTGSVSANFVDNQSLSQNRKENSPTEKVTVTSTRNLNFNYKMLESLTFDVRRDYSSDAYQKGYRAGELVRKAITELDFGEDRNINQTFNTTFSPKLLSWLNGNYRYASNFSYSLRDPSINDRAATLSVNQDYRLDFKMATLMGKIWKPKPKAKGGTNRPAAPKGRSGRRGGGEDPESGNPEEGSKPEDEEKAPRKAPSLSLPNPAVMMWQLLSSFKTFTLDFKNQDAYGYSNLVDMPSYAFQFGFSPDIPFEERNDESFNKNLIAPSIRSTNSVDGNMQVDLFKNLKSNFKYNRQKATTITDANNSETVANTVFFTGGDPGSDTKDWWNLVPDWRFSLNGVENLPMFKSWAKSASLEHARSGKYNEKTRFTTAATDGGDGVVTEGERIKDSFGFSNSYQPLIGLTVNTKWGITSSLRSNRQVTVDYQAAGAATRREQSGINFTASYAVNKGFRLPLPFLANKKLNNEITFQLAFDSNENTNYSRKPNSNEFTELDLAKSWKVRPSVSYRFSQKVNGTAFYEQGSSENKRTGVTSYKEFGINVNIAIR